MKWIDLTKMKWQKHGESVLKTDSENSWEDYSCITPSIFEDASRFLMFYTGQGKKNMSWGLGVAESHDLFHWEKLFDRSIASFSDKSLSGLDGASLISNKERRYIFFESKSLKEDGGLSLKRMISEPLRLWLISLKWGIKDFLGMSMAASHAQDRKIWRVALENLITFDLGIPEVMFEKSGNGWDNCGVFSPRVFRFNDKFYLFYGGSNGKRIDTGLAISDDLNHWNRLFPHPVLNHGKNGEWDQNHALIVDVVRLEDGYAAFYEGEDRHNRYRIGLAFSENLKDWKKFDGNPIIGIDGSQRAACSPHIVIKEGLVYLFYSIHDKYMKGSCGLSIGGY